MVVTDTEFQVNWEYGEMGANNNDLLIYYIKSRNSNVIRPIGFQVDGRGFEAGLAPLSARKACRHLQNNLILYMKFPMTRVGTTEGLCPAVWPSGT